MLSLPYSDFYWLILGVVKTNIIYRHIESLIFGALIGIFIVVCSICIQYIFIEYDIISHDFLRIMLIFISTIPAAFIFFKVYKLFRERIQEKHQLKNFVRRSSFSRTEISEAFLNFEFETNRLKFVEHLRSRDVKVTGEWPDGRCPSKRNDPATTVLMQLEERWRGLDR